jgi:hypothetical protein
MSDRLSYSAPKSVWVLVMRAMRPSKPSRIMAAKMPSAAASKRPALAASTA